MNLIIHLIVNSSVLAISLKKNITFIHIQSQTCTCTIFNSSRQNNEKRSESADFAKSLKLLKFKSLDDNVMITNYDKMRADYTKMRAADDK